MGPSVLLDGDSRVASSDSTLLISAGDMSAETMLFLTTDLVQASEEIGRIYAPHRFKTHSVNRKPATMHNIPGQAIGLSKFSYGADISVEPEVFKDFVLVLTTLTGKADIQTPSFRTMGGAGTTVLIAPEDKSNFRYDLDNTQLVTRIDARKIDDISRTMFGYKEAAFPLASREFSHHQQRIEWHSLLSYFRSLLQPMISPHARAMLLPRAEELLIMSLICAQSDAAGSHRSVSTSINPAYLKRAINFIEGNADQPLTLVEIATVAHCGVRSLHRAFHEWRGISPMRYLKEVRLRRVRQALLNPTNETTVTHIALRWGFMHLGQFALDYRKMFGEKPSETFRRGS